MPYKRFMEAVFCLILLNVSIFAQFKHLSENELKDELTRCLIERLGFKQQAELVDSLINENYKLNQKLWLKEFELKNCADEKFYLSQQLFECPKQSWYDKFAFGFLSTIFLIVLIYGGIAIL